MKKTWLGFLLLILLVLAGCDTGSKSIVFLTNRTDLRNTLLKEAVEQFELKYQDSDWKVRVETITDYENVVSTRLSGNNYGDVLLIPQTVDSRNLDRYFIPFGTVSEMKNQGWNGINTKAFNNQVYGLPIGLQSAGILINNDVFDKAGVNPVTLTTPDLFIQGMEQIQTYAEANITDWKATFHTQTATGWGLAQWAGGVISASGDPDYPNLILPWDQNAFWNQANDEAGTIGKMYELLFNLIASDLVESSPTIDQWEQSKIWFAQGKIAAISVGSWAIQQFEEVAESVEAGRSADIGYMPYPFAKENGDMYASIAADYTIGVAKNSKNKDIAEAFAKWLVEDFNYATKTGNIPPKEGSAYPEKIAAFEASGVILVEETPSPLDYEGALAHAERNAASGPTDEKRIALWDTLWITDFVANAFDVRDNKSSVTVKQLLQDIQSKWNNGINAVIEEFGTKPN